MRRFVLDAAKLRAGENIAEILSPRANWLVVSVMSGEEVLAASHLAARGFGIFVPGHYARGAWVNLLPGYVFICVYGIEHHRERILACPGVQDFLYEMGHPACPFVVPDQFIAAMRSYERERIGENKSGVMYSKPRTRHRRRRRSLRIRKEKTSVQTTGCRNGTKEKRNCPPKAAVFGGVAPQGG
jgi:hypothetical protein